MPPRDDEVRVTGPAGPVRGRVRVPGDKSIAHRALLLAAVARGTARLAGLPDGRDVASTRQAVAALGVPVREEAGLVLVEGRGFAALDRDPAAEPLRLDCGNSGTTARLFLGLLAGRAGRFLLDGDASLRQRPMERVAGPLREMGAGIEGTGTLPLVLAGGPLRPIDLALPVASAQVESALILAALQAPGLSRLVPPGPRRDHTPRMLAALGAPVEVRGEGNPPAEILVRGREGGPDLAPPEMEIPGDPSSAAFLLALAAAIPGSDLAVEGVSVNPTRLGFVRLLARMGARVEVEPVPSPGPEPAGTIRVRGGPLSGIRLGPADVADAIDEVPLVALLGAVAEGETVIRGGGELRVKESDRIAATCALLRGLGAEVEELPDGLAVRGGRNLVGGVVDARGDHRLAMLGAIGGLLARGETRVAGASAAAVSWPGFFRALAGLAGERPAAVAVPGPLPGERPFRAVLLGHPVGHSRSADLFAALARAGGPPVEYRALDVPPAELPGALRRLREGDWDGANVTVPHKRAVAGALDGLGNLAAAAGAVNVVVREEGGGSVTLRGENTDGPGFAAAFREAFGREARPPALRRAVVLGWGGAARGVVAELRRAGVRVVVATRDPAGARAGWPDPGTRFLGSRDPRLAEASAAAGLVVQATPLGMPGGPAPGEGPPVPWDAVSRDAVAVDLVYAPAPTPFVRAARERGLAAIDGWEMLRHQAALAADLWLGPGAGPLLLAATRTLRP